MEVIEIKKKTNLSSLISAYLWKPFIYCLGSSDKILMPNVKKGKKFSAE